MSKKQKVKDEDLEKLKETILYEKNLDDKAIKKNNDAILYVRIVTTIFAGMLSGILNLTGFKGLICYFIFFLIVTPILFFHITKQKGNFSTNIISYLSTGLFSNIMIYIIFWVLFYNLIHIYQ